MPRPLGDEALEAGTVLGDKYRLVRRLQEGGIGTVWVAHNEALDIEVAVKVLRSELTTKAGKRLAKLMINEAQSAAKLGHPAIVRMLDTGKTIGDRPYVVMELLRGDDLAGVIERRGRIGAVQALRVLLPIIDALATAHGAGIIHRDVKPENIFLARTATGSIQPKLIDFGVALMQSTERITSRNHVIGTPRYMSPEQALGEQVDGRADIWSFFVVLYEAISGAWPFSGDDHAEQLRAILEDEPRPFTDYGAGDASLWAIVRRGLEKHPDRRLPTMRTAGGRLAHWLLGEGVTEDICGASLEAKWLEAPSRPDGDSLLPDSDIPGA